MVGQDESAAASAATTTGALIAGGPRDQLSRAGALRGISIAAVTPTAFRSHDSTGSTDRGDDRNREDRLRAILALRQRWLRLCAAATATAAVGDQDGARVRGDRSDGVQRDHASRATAATAVLRALPGATGSRRIEPPGYRDRSGGDQVHRAAAGAGVVGLATRARLARAATVEARHTDEPARG